MKNLLSDAQKHHVSVILLAILLLRIAITGASIGDSIAILALALFAGASLHFNIKHRNESEETKKSLQDLSKQLENQAARFVTFEKMQVEIKDLYQQVGILKIDKAFSVQQMSGNKQRLQNDTNQTPQIKKLF